MLSEGRGANSKGVSSSRNAIRPVSRARSTLSETPPGRTGVRLGAGFNLLHAPAAPATASGSRDASTDKSHWGLSHDPRSRRCSVPPPMSAGRGEPRTAEPRILSAPIRKGKAATAKAVGSFIPRLARKAFERHGFSTVTLLTDWAGLVGAELARTTTPERLIWPRPFESGDAGRSDPRHGATLMLAVDPSHALEVEYKAGQIRERINVHFGYRAVAQVRVHQQPLVAVAATMACEKQAPRSGPPAPAPEIAAIPDPALRDALARLSTSVISESRRTGL